MPDMGKIIGQVGTGIQPGDSQAPQPTGTPLAAPVPAPSPMPPQAPAPGQTPAPAQTPAAGDGGGQAAGGGPVSFADKLKALEQQAQAPDDGAPGEPGLTDRVRNYVKDELQIIKGKYKTGAARNPTEYNTALEQAFGKDNVKVTGDQVWVRPEGSKRFTKFNEDNFISNINAYDAILNQVKNAPELAGKMAGMAAQGTATAVGGAIGLAVTKSPVGAAVGGAIGGFLGSKASKFVDEKQAEWLNQKDPTYKYENNLNFLSKALEGDVGGAVGDAMKNDYVQGALGALGTGFQARAAVEKAALAHKGLSEEAISAVRELSPGESYFGKFVSALENYRDQAVPKQLPEPQSVPQAAMGVAKANLNEVGERLGAMRTDAANEQAKQGKYLQPTEFTKYVRDELSQYGVEFHPSGHVNTTATQLSAAAPPGAKTLMALNDEALNMMYGKNSGLTVDHAETFLDALDKKANYSRDTNLSEDERLFRQARHALSNDRATHYGELYGGQDSPDAQFFKQTLKEYGQKKDSNDILLGLFNTPEKVDLMAKKLSTSGSPQSAQAFNAMEHILGSDSPEFKNLKSAMMDRMIDKATANGQLNPKFIADYIGNPDNEAIATKLFGSKENMNQLQAIANQAQKFKDATEASGTARVMIDKLVGMTLGKLPGGEIGAKLITGVLGNNKASIDYAADATLQAIKQAYGPEQRAAMMEQYNALNAFRAKSNVIDVPITKAGRLDTVKRYAMVASKPTKAPGVPAPAQNQPPTP